jgi:CheY-like chemotaxis protein
MGTLGDDAMSNRRTNVLMVEDEPLITELMTEVLSENGFAVHAVTSGETALRYLDDGPEVDVLFTDINLEGRMDGSTLAKQVRERRPDLPIVYCSGRYSPSALAPMMSRSIFLKKPYDPNELCMLLARLTGAEH